MKKFCSEWKKSQYCENKQFLKIFFDDKFYMIRDEKTGYFNASHLIEKFANSDLDSISANLGDSIKILENFQVSSCYTVSEDFFGANEHCGIYVCHPLLLQMANWVDPDIFTKCYYLTVCKVKKPDRLCKKIKRFLNFTFLGFSNLLFL